VEAPSQMLEEIFHDARILQSFARHYRTNQPLPVSLIEKMNRASAFGRATWIQRQLLYATFALDLHTRLPAQLDFDALQRTEFDRFSPYGYIDNKEYASFTHLIVYSSLLDKVIALDLFGQFNRSNLLDGPTAMRYRNTILAPGGSKPAAELVKDFLGRPQNMDALKVWMGVRFPEVQARLSGLADRHAAGNLGKDGAHGGHDILRQKPSHDNYNGSRQQGVFDKILTPLVLPIM
jgi:thimet oligopeptidase